MAHAKNKILTSGGIYKNSFNYGVKLKTLIFHGEKLINLKLCGVKFSFQKFDWGIVKNTNLWGKNHNFLKNRSTKYNFQKFDPPPF